MPFGPFQIGAYQLQLPFIESKHAAIWKLFTRVVVRFRQAERRIGNKQRTVRSVNEIVGAVEAFSFEAIHENRQRPIFLHTCDASVAVLIDGQSSLRVEASDHWSPVENIQRCLCRSTRYSF